LIARDATGAALALMNDFPLELGTYDKYDSRRKRTRHRFYTIHISQRQLHLLVLGKSGMGKSTALTNYALKDIEQGLGCLFIDPHHDDAEKLLELIPPRRRRDVIYFNPAEYAVSFNVLDNVSERRRALVATSIADSIKTIFNMSNAPNVDMFVQASVAALLETPGSTLLGLNYILDSPTYRNRVIRKIEDPVIRHFWKQTFDEHMTDREQRDRTLSTINKVFTMIADPAIRRSIGQSKSAFSFADILANNKILIVSVPHGDLGIEKSSIVVSFLLAAFHVAALQRPNDQRSLFPVYVNEAHHVINKTIVEGLTGLRKFGISICLSHQSLRQIEEPRLRAMILGSVDTLVCFRLGPDDADDLARQFDNKKPDDLTRLWRHQALVRAGGETRELRMPDLSDKRSRAGAAAIRRNCASLYGRPAAVIDAEIAAFMASMVPKKRPKPPPPSIGETVPSGWSG
jgi:type IV secretory pathway TraG/TraD family ATPase VirD4